MKKVLLSAAMMLMSLGLLAQYTVRGKVTDAVNGDALQGASVFIGKIDKGVATDAGGNFLIKNVPAGKYSLRVSMIGYRDVEIDIDVANEVVVTVIMDRSFVGLDEVIVTGTRATENTPTTFTNVKKEDIEKQNLGQDLPFLLNWTPGVVTTSDAGAGIGYTGIRIRGSDPTRINVTINGIPVNDSESQGVFWVNTPDLATSTDNIQVQRGVGTSTNGAGAFGASINVLTNGLSQEPMARVNSTFGSYNTQKFNAVYSTGLLADKWAFEGRLSSITSDGFIDRASADLSSYYLSGGYYGKKSVIKFVTFSGNEVTYQSWWGTPEAKLKGDAAGIEAVIANNGYTAAQAENLRNSGRTFNFYQYDNQVDDYGQDHYQLHFAHTFNTEWSLNSALFYTKGGGFFEEFRNDDDLADYQLDDVVIGATTINSSDLIRRRWLDNDFYGMTYGLNYETEDVTAVLGGGYNKYDGLHFGEVIWAQFASNGSIRHRYYESNSDKTDFNTFFKLNYQVSPNLNLFGDLQLRAVGYSGMGVDNDLRPIDFDENYTFFNPKFGATLDLGGNANVYASFAVGNKEPNRSDIIDATPGTFPEHETLNNLEIGYRKAAGNYAFQVNYYLMDYTNQLVLTGEVNDVGAGIRTNVADSYRMGIEAQLGMKIASKLNWNVNVALSENKISEFNELILDYGPAFDEFNEVRTTFEDTDIAFSPSVVLGSQLSYEPAEGFSMSLLSKYVGDQFLDNTQNENRKIDAFFVNDVRINYIFKTKAIKEVSLNLLVNNVFNTEYESNGYTFGYFGGRDFEVRENYLYPQAGTNFLFSVGLGF